MIAIEDKYKNRLSGVNVKTAWRLVIRMITIVSSCTWSLVYVIAFVWLVYLRFLEAACEVMVP